MSISGTHSEEKSCESSSLMQKFLKTRALCVAPVAVAWEEEPICTLSLTCKVLWITVLVKWLNVNLNYKYMQTSAIWKTRTGTTHCIMGFVLLAILERIQRSLKAHSSYGRTSVLSLVSGPIIALSAASPRPQVTICGRRSSSPRGGR